VGRVVALSAAAALRLGEGLKASSPSSTRIRSKGRTSLVTRSAGAPASPWELLAYFVLLGLGGIRE
jgi:hypothetical protein